MPSVIITGADRGLGLSLCKEYLRRGFTVFAGKYLEDYTLLEDINHANLHIIRLDMGCGESIKAAAETVRQQSGTLDMLISNAALMERPSDLEMVWRMFNVNALGPLRLVESVLPLMKNSGLKRLCFVSSEVACISLMKHRAGDAYAYPMSKASLNMAVRMLHNQLHGEGYSFRLFHPGWMKRRAQDGSLSEHALYDPDEIGNKAAAYFDAPIRDANRLVMVDYAGYEWPW